MYQYLKIFVVKPQKYDMVDSTIMNLELMGEFLSCLENVKGLSQGLDCFGKQS